MHKFRVRDTDSQTHPVEAHRADLVENGEFLDFSDEKGLLVFRISARNFHSFEVERETANA